MIHRPLGASGLQASIVGLGTWAIGGWMWGGTDEADAIDAIRASVDAGVTLVDTAPAYGFGRSEEIVGRALRGIRDRVLLATKCGLVWDRSDGEFFFAADEQGRNESGPFRVHRFLGPASIRAEVETSLRRLQTDRIDLLQTHWPDATTAIEETVACLMQLKKEGKIRAIGACNLNAGQLDRYRRAGTLDADQERFSMIDRGMEAERLPACRRENIAVIAYSPLAHGLLTGRVTGERGYGEGDLRRENPRFRPDPVRRVRALLDRLEPVARRRRASLAQLAIAWAVNQPGVTHALAGARTPAQARENAAAASVALTPPDLAEIRAALEAFERPARISSPGTAAGGVT